MLRREAVVEIAEPDLVAAQRLIQRDCFRQRSRQWMLALLWCVSTGYFALLASGAVPGGLAGTVLLSAIGSLLLVFGAPILLARLFGPYAARRNFRAVPAFQAPLHYGWDEEGFSVESLSGRSLHRWPAFRRWLEDDALLLIWPHPATYLVLPKRSFAPAQIEDLRRFLQKKPGT